MTACGSAVVSSVSVTISPGAGVAHAGIIPAVAFDDRLWMVCCPTAIRRRTCRSGRLFALRAPKHDVHREVCGSGFHHAVAEGREIQALEHRLAPSEKDRRKRKVQFIDQAGLQVLANGRDATSDLDVACSRGVACAL